MTNEGDTNDGGAGPSVPAELEKPSLLRRLRGFFGNKPDGELVTPTATPLSLNGNIKIAWGGQPFEMTLGNVAIEFHPDIPVTGTVSDGSREWIVHTGRAFYEDVPRFIRIRPGESVLLGRIDELHESIFQFDKSVANRHVQISNHKGWLTIQPLELERSTSILAIDSAEAVWTARSQNLMRLPDLLGHPLRQFDDDEALDVIRNVNIVLASETCRDLDDDGAPGGIIRIPDDVTVVLMGDVHARADNLLTVICEGGLLSSLERGKACLVLLGDLIHSQEINELEDMESSVFILDLFCMLKLRFPQNVFLLHGNHESFSPDVGKGGVPQGVLLRKHLKKRRGKVYVGEIETLFDSLAFVVQGNDFAACHGAPVRSRVTRNTLVNIRRYPGVQYEIIWNRLRQGNRPAGYGKGSVKRFRRTLDLSKHAPLIVSHTPQSAEESLWLNVGDIPGHHIVYSANTSRAAAMVMRDRQMTPVEFIPEPALAFVNDKPDG